MSGSSFQIRRAGPDDAAELARLRYEFRTEQRRPTESEAIFRERCRKWMAERLLPEAAWRCWVAVHQEKLVGTLWLQLIEKLPNPGDEPERHGYISSVYVVPAVRRAGVGSALLATALQECNEQELDAVFLWCTPQSRALYQRNGFVRRDELLERVLGSKA